MICVRNSDMIVQHSGIKCQVCCYEMKPGIQKHFNHKNLTALSKKDCFVCFY